MKNPNHRLICILFCLFLFAMAGLYLFLPKQTFSRQEKRYLEEPPRLTWQTLTSGEFSRAADRYMADHIPGRNFFVGLAAYFDLFTGRQPTKEIWRIGADRLAEAPAVQNPAAVSKNMSVINDFAQSTGAAVDFMLIPSAGWAAQLGTGKEDYPDESVIAGAYALAEAGVTPVDVLQLFSRQQARELYYKTDHHWNSRGAYLAYRNYMELLGREYPAQDAFQIETVPGFRGSTYSRSALWLTAAESLELWHGPGNILTTHEESREPHSGVFFRQRLEEADKYTVFLDGNHAMVRMENPDTAGKGKLLVIRDSYANCLGGFLAESFQSVVLIDLRYYRLPVSELMAAEGFDRVLICYSLGNFLTDTNLVWLR